MVKNFRSNRSSGTPIDGDVPARSWAVHHPLRLFAAYGSVLLVLFGCGGDQGSGGGGVVRRDSAGIRLSESSAPRLTELQSWTIEPVPMLQIGSVDGTPSETLLRVGGAGMLSDGRLVVLNGGTLELRIYASSGEFISSVGRRGGGPGEFQLPSGMVIGPGDSIGVFDLLLARVNVFDSDLNLQRTVPTPGMDGILALLPDGSFVGFRDWTPMWDTTEVRTGTILHERRTVAVYDHTGDVIQTIGEFDAAEIVLFPDQGRLTAIPPPLWRRLFTTMRGSDLVVVHTGAVELREYGVDGGLRGIDRAAIDPLPVLPEDRQPYIDQASRTPGQNFVLQAVGIRDTHPAVNRIVADKAGNIWVELYSRSGTQEPQRWAVFEPSGAWITDVQLPRGLRPLEIADDYLLGLTRDELDVEYVVQHQLRK